MKRTIVIAAVLGLAANAFAFQSSEVSQVLKEHLAATYNTPIAQSHTGSIAGGISDLGSATGQDAVSAKDAAVKGVKRAGKEVGIAASATKDTALDGFEFSEEKAISAGQATAASATNAGVYVYDKSLKPTGELFVLSGNKVVSAAEWIVTDLPAEVSAGVENVYYGLEFSVSAVGGDMGLTGTGKATGQDASSLYNKSLGESKSNSVSDNAAVAQSGASSGASAAFSSNPVAEISAYKQEQVRKAAQAARRVINAYGADSKQAVAATLKLGEYSASLANKRVTANQAFGAGMLFVSALNM